MGGPLSVPTGSGEDEYWDEEEVRDLFEGSPEVDGAGPRYLLRVFYPGSPRVLHSPTPLPPVVPTPTPSLCPLWSRLPLLL